SSVGWLLTSCYFDSIGWRGICLTWGFAQIAIALPLYLLLPQVADSRPVAASGQPPEPWERLSTAHDDKLMVVMALAFCAGALVVSGFAAHLPHLLSLSGISQKDALAAAALAGPAQIFMRLIEAVGFTRRSPLLVVSSSSLLHPIGAFLLLISAPFAPLLFPMLHGMTSGVVITARATVPLTVFGPNAFGVRLGRLSRSIRVVSALAPLLFAILIERLGLGVLWISSALCLTSILGFGLLKSMMTDIAPASLEAANKQG
ncbi:MAG: hypothetical protein JSS20_15605, partial [Proteobacteria bacterium]|nr:hypothetical protein [Pseudomonadota bacterium]